MKRYKPLQTREQAAESLMRSSGYDTNSMSRNEYERILSMAMDALDEEQDREADR